MNVADRAISHLVIIGGWRPKKLISNLSKQLYKLYSCFILLILTLSEIYMLIDILIFSENVNLLTESLLELLTVFGAIIKMLLFIIKQEEIISIDRMLTEKICLPRDEIEKKILAKSKNSIRKLLDAIMIGCYLFTTSLCIIPLFSSKKWALPYPSIWIPLTFESLMYYLLIYLYESFVFVLTTISLCCCNIYMMELLEAISAELDLFKHRLFNFQLQKKIDFKSKNNKYELTIIKDWLHFHLHLIKIVRRVNNTFNLIFILQFLISTAVLGLTIFHLARVELFTTHFWFMYIHFFDYMMEIFLFSYYGQKLIIKSTEIVDACYSANWNTLSKSSRMSLYIIMIRASKPMKIVGGSMVTMSTSTLLKILKVSYSLFNVLREIHQDANPNLSKLHGSNQ